MPSSSRLALDTHVWIWLLEGDPRLGANARRAIDESGDILIPAIVPWEVAMLANRGRISVAGPVKAAIQKGLSAPGFSLAPLSPEIAVEAVALPGSFHKDPADRLIVATARMLGATLVTRDETILAYAAEGHLRALAA